MQRSTIETVSFAVAVVLVTAAFLWLLLPYYGGVLWAVIFAIVFRPLNAWLLARTGGRRNLAAGLCLLACIFIVLIPGGIVLQSLLDEVNRLYNRAEPGAFDSAAAIQSLWDNLPDILLQGLSWLGLDQPDQLLAWATRFFGQIANSVASYSVQLGQSTVQFAINIGIMLYTLFFLFRDGPGLVAAIRRASPLSPGSTDHIFGKFASAVKATVKGNLIIAVLQGTLGGLIFWLLGIPAAILWGALMVLLSLLPVVGAALVWVPVAGYLLVSGDTTRGIVLLAFGTLVIGLVDNLLRPVLVGRDLRLPDYVILVSTVGGIALFGMNGFVIGPMIAALFVAVWSLLADGQSAD